MLDSIDYDVKRPTCIKSYGAKKNCFKSLLLLYLPSRSIQSNRTSLLKQLKVQSKQCGSSAATPPDVNSHLRPKQLEAIISPVINVKTFLSVIVVVILRINTIKLNITAKAVVFFV